MESNIEARLISVVGVAAVAFLLGSYLVGYFGIWGFVVGYLGYGAHILLAVFSIYIIGKAGKRLLL
jgi:hypothetical protein